MNAIINNIWTYYAVFIYIQQFTTRLDSFLQTNLILYDSQYGFQTNRSTGSAVIE